MATLYLGFEGVLHPSDVTFREGKWPTLRAAGHEFFENGPQLEQVLASCPNTRIILHSWWVPRFGYWESVRLLPQTVQSCVIGATWPGNRLLRFPRKPIEMRRAWLEADLQRRRPANPVLLDCEYSQIPRALIGRSCILDGRTGLASDEACESLISLLAVGNTVQPPALPMAPAKAWPARRVASFGSLKDAQYDEQNKKLVEQQQLFILEL